MTRVVQASWPVWLAVVKRVQHIRMTGQEACPTCQDWFVPETGVTMQMMLAGEFEPLIEYDKLGREAMLSIPTPDHYLPLLYVIATIQHGEVIRFPVEGMDGGSISMRAVQVGSAREGTDVQPAQNR